LFEPPEKIAPNRKMKMSGKAKVKLVAAAIQQSLLPIANREGAFFSTASANSLAKTGPSSGGSTHSVISTYEAVGT